MNHLNRKGLICALFILHFIALPAVIHLARLSEGKELPQFQHFVSTKTSNKCLNLGEDNKCRDIIR